MAPKQQPSLTPTDPLDGASLPSRGPLPPRVADLLKKVEALCGRTDTNGMSFLYQGDRIGMTGADPGIITPTASCTKSVIALAVFKLVGEGKLTIDQPLHEILSGTGYERWKHFSQGEYRNITTRHLLTHTSGLPGNDWFLPKDERWRITGDNQFNNHLADYYDRNVRAAMHPLLYKVGARGDYSNPATQIVVAVIEKALRDSGDNRTVAAFITAEIFDPLHVKHTFLTEEKGITMGNGGMRSTALNLATLAECVRQKGRWLDRQIIAEDAVAEMLSTPTTIVGANPRYAHLWFRLGDYGFAAIGDLNNCAIILPDDEIVIARTQPIPPEAFTTHGSQELSDAGKEAEAKANEFWHTLVTADTSILTEFRKNRAGRVLGA